MRNVFYLVLSFVIGLALGIVGTLYHGTLAGPDVPIPVEVQQSDPEPVLLPSRLDELQVTVIRVGMDVSLLLDWERRKRAVPFHIWIEVDGSSVTLYSPGNKPRTIEVIPGAELLFYGSTLYHEHNQNRLAVDLQVKQLEENGDRDED